MDSGSTSLTQLASQKMTWLSHRQRVISENVANADTPGYAARDVESFDDYLRRPDGAAVRVESAKSEWGSSMDGNGVVLEEQAIKAAETSGQYRLATRLYSKAYSLMSIVNGK